jgi:deoxyribonuclease-4
MAEKNILLLGAHMSIAGGFEKAIERGESIGCTAIQIFSKSNRQWFAKPINDTQADSFKAALKNSFIESIIIHASYLINLGSPDKTILHKSTKALIEELERAEQLGIKYVVLHPGAHLNSGENICLDHIADTLNNILDSTPRSTALLLEIMAGQGSSVCYTFEQLATLYNQSSHKKRIGICFDTCHAFAAGYDFRTENTYEKLWKEFDTILGLDLLKAMHINDSKKPLGSRIDRHEEIGDGLIGLTGFKLLFNDPRFFNVPKILETPHDNLTHYLKNMQLIVQLITPQNQRKLEIKVRQNL